MANSVPIRIEGRPGAPAGWQLYDGRTGAFLEEGPWLEETAEVEATLPEADGDYRFFVSPVDVDRGWAYERGQRFRIIDVKVSGGKAEAPRERSTTLRRLQFENLPARGGRFFTLPFTCLWRNRSLIGAMVRRDVLGRYRGSFGGLSWSILHPLLMTLTYYFVFGVVLRAKFAGDDSQSGFVLYYLAGMLPWLAFSESVGRAPHVIQEYRSFVKKLVFPVEILPFNLVISGLFTSALALIVYLFFLMAVRETISPFALWLPVLILPQILFTAGICWIFAGIGVFVRDLGQINGFLLTLLFFLTPICYPEQSLPQGAIRTLKRNPMYREVLNFRRVFLENVQPDWNDVIRIWIIGFVLFYAGYWFFRRVQRNFVDVL